MYWFVRYIERKKLFGVKWIHFIDSGGQLQYHDILPLFIQKPAVAIFVLNLSEELSHQPTIIKYELVASILQGLLG